MRGARLSKIVSCSSRRSRINGAMRLKVWSALGKKIAKRASKIWSNAPGKLLQVFCGLLCQIML